MSSDGHGRSSRDVHARKAAPKLHHAPIRLTAGALIPGSGRGKHEADEETAPGPHGMASGVHPFLGKVPPTGFVRLFSAELALVAAPLLPPGWWGPVWPRSPPALAGAPLGELFVQHRRSTLGTGLMGGSGGGEAVVPHPPAPVPLRPAEPVER